ncbi:putative transcriptional regulator [Janibacter sp. HTCC2649]|uniref:helix-turn-helix transcriptional regulator n=1 Tax=Janibacter sp. HTCC2649 TaxID=313589 RepID=UPI000067188C|nr:transcriptional regulator [Janibacter sp. HTCC2649]EAP98417.1 putative transcriptional regulator [Janibacter sp. HTCC2649]
MSVNSPDITSPGRLLEEYFDREDARIEERLRDLGQVRGLLDRLRETDPAHPTPGVEPISDEMAPTVVQRLIHDSSGILRNLVMVVDAGPALDDATMRHNQQWVADGNIQRTIYPAKALDTPQGLQWLRSWSTVGEAQRLLPEVGSEYAVFGDVGAVALRQWGDISSGYVVIRDPLLISTLAAHFDLAWEHAHAVPFAASLPGDERLLELLGMGLKDEAIARFLGIGLRTVRRRIAALMSVHGVDTRFQLGAALSSKRPRIR